MRSLVEVCAEQRAMNWREWAIVKDAERERWTARRRNQRGIKRPASPPPNSNPKASLQREKALELYRQGMNSTDVGRELRVKPATVKDWARKAGIRGAAKERRDAVRVEQLRHTLRAEGRL